MQKVFFIFLTAILLWQSASFASCTSDDHAASQNEQATLIPQAPDYNDAAMWVTNADMAQCSHIRPAEGETDTGVTICYNTVKDVKYVIPVISASDICINPVNWRTDATPATLHDTITVTVAPSHHVLVVSGYSASEYSPYRGFLNVGDIHSCEPWLYSECLAQNIKVRAKEWRKLHQPM